MTIGTGVGGAGGAGLGVYSAPEGQKLRGGIVGGATGATLGGGIGALMSAGGINPKAVLKKIDDSRNKGFALGLAEGGQRTADELANTPQALIGLMKQIQAQKPENLKTVLESFQGSGGKNWLTKMLGG